MVHERLKSKRRKRFKDRVGARKLVRKYIALVVINHGY